VAPGPIGVFLLATQESKPYRWAFPLILEPASGRFRRLAEVGLDLWDDLLGKNMQESFGQDSVSFFGPHYRLDNATPPTPGRPIELGLSQELPSLSGVGEEG
jgi:hypothetical protein